MNVFKLCVATVFCFTMASCSNEDLDYVSVPDQLPKTKSVENVIELSTVAQLVASMEMDQAVMDEIKEGVDRSLSYGLDEEFRFIDMLQPTSSKLFRNTNSLSFVEKLKNLLNSSSLTKGAEVNSLEIFDYLSQNDIQIYWPYSKKWDGKMRPVITYLQEGDKNYRLGYVQNGDSQIDTISLNKDFVKNNPVWIINKNNTPYDELPDFENGEFVNEDGVFFYSKKANEWLSKKQSRIGLGSPVYIGEITVSERDGLIGGSELYFMWGHAGGGMGLPIQGMLNTYRMNIPNNELDLVKKIDLNIQPGWTTYEKTNALIILEKDGGKNKSTTRNLIYTNPSGMVDVTVPVSFKYEKRDEWLYDGIFERKNIFSSANKGSDGKYKQYHGSGIYFTLTTPEFTE